MQDKKLEISTLFVTTPHTLIQHSSAKLRFATRPISFNAAIVGPGYAPTHTNTCGDFRPITLWL